MTFPLPDCVDSDILTTGRKSETWTPSNGEHMRGPIAVKKLIEIRPRIILDQTERRDRWLFRNWCKPIVNYHHIASCFHGSNPQVVVQGHKGLGRSIYFRRCNRDLINAFREVLEVSEYKEPGNKTEDDSHITETQEDEKDGKRKRKIEDENEDGVQVKQARRNPIITHMIDEIEAYIDEHNAHSKMESSTARETTLTPSSPEDLKRACQGLSTETIIKYEEYVATGKWSFTVDCLAELSWRSTRERGDGEEIWSDSEEDPGESETDN